MEDKRFFQHGAFDPMGIARVHFGWIYGTRSCGQGASNDQSAAGTVCIFLDVHRTLAWRKALEAALAFYLELRYSKPQLLGMYLNQVYWGQDGTDTLPGH